MKSYFFTRFGTFLLNDGLWITAVPTAMTSHSRWEEFRASYAVEIEDLPPNIRGKLETAFKPKQVGEKIPLNGTEQRDLEEFFDRILSKKENNFPHLESVAEELPLTLVQDAFNLTPDLLWQRLPDLARIQWFRVKDDVITLHAQLIPEVIERLQRNLAETSESLRASNRDISRQLERQTDRIEQGLNTLSTIEAELVLHWKDIEEMMETVKRGYDEFRFNGDRVLNRLDRILEKQEWEEDYLKDKLASNWDKVKETWDKMKRGKISKRDFVLEGVKSMLKHGGKIAAKTFVSIVSGGLIDIG